MAYDEGLAERVRELLAERRGISEKRMFGGLQFLRDGHLFVGVSKEKLMVRVGLALLPAALARPHTQALKFKSRPTIIGYVMVAPDGVDYDDDLASWVALADQCAATLPPGPKSKPKPKQAKVVAKSKPAQQTKTTAKPKR